MVAGRKTKTSPGSGPPVPRRTPGSRNRHDPKLLRTVPRAAHRRKIGLRGPLPFTGVDAWTAYELSWLDPGGKPRVAIGRFEFRAESPGMIESKSFKLYLNSYSQEPFESPLALERALGNDLAAACGDAVAVRLTLPEAFRRERIGELAGDLIDDLEVATRTYRPDPSFLEAEGPVIAEALTSNLLKSNCPLTGQPDWASVRVAYRGPRMSRQGLLKYLVSFRRHSEFHEHCVERIFTDILRRCRPERLTVHARYTRRGGIDINPFRTNCGERPFPGRRTARQ